MKHFQNNNNVHKKPKSEILLKYHEQFMWDFLQFNYSWENEFNDYSNHEIFICTNGTKSIQQLPTKTYIYWIMCMSNTSTSIIYYEHASKFHLWCI